MNIRPLTEGDLPQCRSLWSYCFQDDEAFLDLYFGTYFEDGGGIGAFEGDELIGQVLFTPYRLQVRGRALPAKFLCGVSVWPERRGGGVTTKLMAAALAALRAEGVPIAPLSPFSPDFYRRYGFEVLASGYQGACELSRITARPGGGERFVRDPGTPAMLQAYRAFAKNYGGVILRDEKEMDYVMGDNALEGGSAVALLRGGREAPAGSGTPGGSGDPGTGTPGGSGTSGGSGDPWAGYLLYRITPEGVRVREMVYADPLARQSLLAFLASHYSTAKRAVWREPGVAMMDQGFGDGRGIFTLQPEGMYRVVDVEKAVAALALPEPERPFTLRVRDSRAPWNDGVFRFSGEKGRMSARPAYEKPEGELDIGAFTAYLMGGFTPAELRAAGRLRGGLPELSRERVFMWETY
ncbi:GNAT family N-acetyltransferase [Gehongia tenuis]|uniref:GNAT family N-acetyltransferase n=1 Tax=Gehongia tenuis TaxID=2763655 RepID=A0A926D2L0_9FIRM|nr:GNAT family N-acetyltransferase [Gehongia tenuis]MBC8530603.1 GNAT family N-acetyltransferase [Gehongia tenuis]